MALHVQASNLAIKTWFQIKSVGSVLSVFRHSPNLKTLKKAGQDGGRWLAARLQNVMSSVHKYCSIWCTGRTMSMVQRTQLLIDSCNAAC
jgi:hypothetical protein